jgi:hypothetical protein
MNADRMQRLTAEDAKAAEEGSTAGRKGRKVNLVKNFATQEREDNAKGGI